MKDMKFKCKIKPRYNFRRFDQIEKEMPNIIKESVEDVLKNIRIMAIKLEKGHHSDGILIELIDTSNMQIKGRIYTDKNVMPWAMFEHFGTGDFRELEAVGVTKHFIETGGSRWFIPVSKVDKKLGYPIIEIQGQEFYLAHRS